MEARGFRWSNGSAGSTRSTVQKGIYFGLLTPPNITRAVHCVRTRVLDISIAWIESVPGHIVGERVYRYGPGGEYRLLCGSCLPPCTPTFRYRRGGYPAARKQVKKAQKPFKDSNKNISRVLHISISRSLSFCRKIIRILDSRVYI